MSKEYQKNTSFKTFSSTPLPDTMDVFISAYEDIRKGVENKTGFTIPKITWNGAAEDNPWLNMFEKYQSTVTVQDQFEHKFYRFWLDNIVEWKAALLWNEIRNHYLRVGDKNGGGERKGTAIADEAFTQYMNTFK